MGLVGVSVGGEAPLYAPFLVAAAAMGIAALAAGRAEETAGRKLGAGDDDDDDDDDDDRLRGDAGDAGALLGRAALRSSAEADTA
jgi:hypothetical protein